jgi:hypothetical protein
MTGADGVAIPTSKDETTAGHEVRGAEILPFPVRAAPKPAVAPNPGLTPEQARLAKALDALNAALADQRAALAAWRGVLGELKASTAGLESSLHRYRGSLASLGTSVSSLREKARALETWADKAIAGQEPDKRG